MHQLIRDNLEEYLNGSRQNVPEQFHAHLAGCEGCASELRLLQKQAAMLGSLRSSEEAEPAPGFYARVMDRIEQQGRDCMWSVFLEPRFGRRLAIASAGLVLLLTTYLVTTEPSARPLAPSAVAVSSQQPPISEADGSLAVDTFEQQQQRDAVLVDLASFRQ